MDSQVILMYTIFNLMTLFSNAYIYHEKLILFRQWKVCRLFLYNLMFSQNISTDHRGRWEEMDFLDVDILYVYTNVSP